MEHTHIFNENAKCINCDRTPDELGINQTPAQEAPAADAPAPAETPAVQEAEVVAPEPEAQPTQPEPAAEAAPAPAQDAQPAPTQPEKSVDELLPENLNVVYTQLKHVKEQAEGEKARQYAIAVTHLETAILWFNSARNN